MLKLCHVLNVLRESFLLKYIGGVCYIGCTPWLNIVGGGGGELKRHPLHSRFLCLWSFDHCPYNLGGVRIHRKMLKHSQRNNVPPLSIASNEEINVCKLLVVSRAIFMQEFVMQSSFTADC